MIGRKTKLIHQLSERLDDYGEILAYRQQELDRLTGVAKRAEDERDAWKDTAQQYARKVDYYTILLDLIAEQLGEDAYRCDDGSFSVDPLRAKMPDLVSDLCRQLHYYKHQHPVIEAEFIFIEAVKP